MGRFDPGFPRRTPSLERFPLRWRGNPAIIDLKNKNAAAYGCANTRKPAQVKAHLYNGLQTVSAWDIIRHSTLVCQRVLLAYLFLPLFVGWNTLFTLCWLARTVFLFYPAPRGRKRPREHQRFKK